MGVNKNLSVFIRSILLFWWQRPKVCLLHSAEISPDPVMSAVYEERNNYTCQGITSIIHSLLCASYSSVGFHSTSAPLIEKQGCIMHIKVDISGHHWLGSFMFCCCCGCCCSYYGALIAVFMKTNKQKHTKLNCPSITFQFLLWKDKENLANSIWKFPMIRLRKKCPRT